MRTTLFILSVLVLSLACAPESISSSSQPISGGMASDNDAVVFVSADGTTCSGTVIGPRHVLTAKLCLFNADVPVRIARVRILVGPDPAAPAQTSGATQLFMEDPDTPSVRADPNMNDLALIVTEDVLMPTPAVLGSTAAVVDDVVTIAGFGQTELGGSGARQEAQLTVAMVTDDLFMSDRSSSVVACSGDAGGPALDASGDLVGVPLFIFGGGTPMCGAAGTGMRDVTRYRDDILAWMATSDMDAGAPDGGVTDAGEPDVGFDARPGVDEAGVDAGGGGGGGCATSTGTSFAWIALLVLAWRRRST